MPDPLPSGSPTAGSVGGSGAGAPTSTFNPFAGGGSSEPAAPATPPASTPPPATPPATPPQPGTVTLPPSPPAQVPPAVVNDPNAQPGQQPPGQTPPAQPGQQPPGQQPPPGQPQILTPEAIAAAVRAGLQPQAPDPNEPPAMTPEQLRQHFEVVEPTEHEVAAIFAGGPNAATTMRDLLHRTARMGTKLTLHIVQGLVNGVRNELRQEFGGTRDFAQQQMVQQQTQVFYSEYPELKAYEPVLISVYERLKLEGFQGTPAEVRKRIADDARKLITAVNPQAFANGAPGAAVPPGTNQPQPQPGQSRMAALPSVGSGGGAPPSAGGKSTAERFFG